MTKHNRISNLQIVFLDIEKYSLRRSLSQINVIDAFTDILGAALGDVSREYVEYSQKNGINFQSDIIKLPTGDGAAVIFSFDGLHNIHLSFTLSVFKHVWERNSSQECEHFSANGWCNCHAHFNLKAGLSEGKGIVYRDVNGNFNVAGGAINMAARVMDQAERNHIMFTEEAYKQIIDMVDTPALMSHFAEYKGVGIKHEEKIVIYQYVDPSVPFVNSAPPEDLLLSQKAKETMKKLGRFSGLGFGSLGEGKVDRKAMLGVLEAMAGGMEALQSAVKPKEISVGDEPESS